MDIEYHQEIFSILILDENIGGMQQAAVDSGRSYVTNLPHPSSLGCTKSRTHPPCFQFEHESAKSFCKRILNFETEIINPTPIVS